MKMQVFLASIPIPISVSGHHQYILHPLKPQSQGFMQRLLLMNSLQCDTMAHICLSDPCENQIKYCAFKNKSCLSLHNYLKIPCSVLNMQHNFCKENIHVRNISLVYWIDYVVPNASIFKYIFSVTYYALHAPK